ncbi:hypothetical protein BD289DRAFT_442039 [Coniella lustricola]|uniref:Uncharacterized protein n=1 Tax=Coniella lustricola TaxID=2025994 RepID=A0A2T2ZYP0_9PEZI|nr:hypothetical protein BD289DRAFT_442039 [Coniella lustricola]
MRVTVSQNGVVHMLTLVVLVVLVCLVLKIAQDFFHLICYFVAASRELRVLFPGLLGSGLPGLLGLGFPELLGSGLPAPLGLLPVGIDSPGRLGFGIAQSGFVVGRCYDGGMGTVGPGANSSLLSRPMQLWGLQEFSFRVVHQDEGGQNGVGNHGDILTVTIVGNKYKAN